MGGAMLRQGGCMQALHAGTAISTQVQGKLGSACKGCCASESCVHVRQAGWQACAALAAAEPWLREPLPSRCGGWDLGTAHAQDDPAAADGRAASGPRCRPEPTSSHRV